MIVVLMSHLSDWFRVSALCLGGCFSQVCFSIVELAEPREESVEGSVSPCLSGSGMSAPEGLQSTSLKGMSCRETCPSADLPGCQNSSSPASGGRAAFGDHR
ncbi:unnamed protein product [Pleuronectes platessa]|uniref:Secreted protein n=1 Tax=Pleuronectes platessa TaxID=8262 RepID=A0A9N7UCM3_PLEPL|nr:unnamed protein product [Pleuronectes platessa]